MARSRPLLDEPDDDELLDDELLDDELDELEDELLELLDDSPHSDSVTVAVPVAGKIRL